MRHGAAGTDLRRRRPGEGTYLVLAALAAAVVSLMARPHGPAPHPGARPAEPEHTQVVVTTFWVGEVFDPHAADGSQRVSTYDARWLEHYGGCDGVEVAGERRTEERRAADGWFPRHMTPQENPFYLDLPYDDLHDAEAFARRCEVVPWADDAGYAGHCDDHGFSYLKNRWVRVVGPTGRECYGQVQDAGPAEYHDAGYVFGDDPPRSHEFEGAGLDVSPALNGCLGLRELDGSGERVTWQFVEDTDVPAGPWRRLVTTSGVTR